MNIKRLWASSWASLAPRSGDVLEWWAELYSRICLFPPRLELSLYCKDGCKQTIPLCSVHTDKYYHCGLYNNRTGRKSAALYAVEIFSPAYTTRYLTCFLMVLTKNSWYTATYSTVCGERRYVTLARV